MPKSPSAGLTLAPLPLYTAPNPTCSQGNLGVGTALQPGLGPRSGLAQQRLSYLLGSKQGRRIGMAVGSWASLGGPQSDSGTGSCSSDPDDMGAKP